MQYTSTYVSKVRCCVYKKFVMCQRLDVVYIKRGGENDDSECLGMALGGDGGDVEYGSLRLTILVIRVV